MHLRVTEGRVLSADSLIVSCPHELTISWLNIMSGSESFLSYFNLDEAFYTINQVVIVRLFIVNEYLKQRESFWWPYIRSLPQPFQAHLFATPLWYEDSDWAWIRGTSLESNARQTERIWREEYAAAIRSLDLVSRLSTSEWSWFVIRERSVESLLKILGSSTNGQPRS